MPRLVFILFALLFLPPIASKEKVISLCYNLTPIPPFINHANADTGARDGFFFDFLDVVQRQAGMRFELKHLSSKRCNEQVRRGKIDGIPGLLWSKERARDFHFPEGSGSTLSHPQRIDTVTNIVFVHVDSELLWDGISFKNIKYGIGAGYGYLIQDKLEQARVLEKGVMSAEQGLILVTMNKLDGYIVEDIIGHYLSKHLAIGDKLKTLELPYNQADLFFVFSKTSRNLSPEDATKVWLVIQGLNTN